MGTNSGVILLFSWNDFGDCTDRFPGHPESVNCISKIKDSTFITGSGDGSIRAISILPNALVSTIGGTADESIESMDISPCKKYLATTSLDETIKIWDAELDKNDVDLFEQSDEESVASPKFNSKSNNGFFEDID